MRQLISDPGSLGRGLGVAIVAWVALLPSSGSAAAIEEFFWGAACPGPEGHVDNRPGYPFYPLGPMTDSGGHTHVIGGDQIEFTGDYYVSRNGPGADVSLIGVGLPARSRAIATYSKRNASFADFEYEVRVVRATTDPPEEARDCYVPLDLKAYGHAAIVLTTPARGHANVLLEMPEYYTWDGNEYQHRRKSETAQMALAKHESPYTGEPESVVLSEDFLVDKRVFVHMTTKIGLVVLPIHAWVDISGEVSVTGGESGMASLPVHGGFFYGRAFVDPVFEIDPTWELADYFTVQVSPGVEQVFRSAAELNLPPTDITLSGNTVVENLPAGTVVGTLAAADVNTNDSHTFTLVTGPGDTDNAAFAITGDCLRTARPLDYETQSQCRVRIRVENQKEAAFEKVFEILVSDVNDPDPSNIAVLENLVVVGGQFQFEFATLPTVQYVVQYSPAVAGVPWETIETVSGNGDRHTVTDTLGETRRFYRVSSQ